jgi:uncharacterized protein involved in outer membrane biogenesis
MIKRLGLPSKIALALVALLLIVLVLFDWNWLRGPMNRAISEKTQRTFDSSHLDVELGWNPVIRLRDVYFANAEWADRTGERPMARIGTLEFSVSLRELFNGEVLVPRVALDQAELNFEIAKDDRRNWVLNEPSEASEPSRFTISSLSVTEGRLRFVDQGLPMQFDVEVDTFDPAAEAKAAKAEAAPVNDRYTTRYRFSGHYHDAKFSGNALTGDVLSFQDSKVPFPLKGTLNAGTTRLDVEGTVADAVNISGIDVRLKIAGRTLANLYPFLLLPLPASPPYQLSGHLTLDGNRYAMQDIQGRIGKTDVAGEAAYVERENRPLLTAKLHSKLLRLEDLGPLVGVTTKTTKDATPPTQAETSTRAQAAATERAANGERALPAGTIRGERLLPTGSFEGGRFKAIDAKADLTVERIDAPDFIALQNLRVGLNLTDAVLRLDPFNVDLADGQIVSRITLDARDPTLKANVDVQARKLRLARLVPPSPRLAPSTGSIGARAVLSGTGNSIADLAGKANGEISAVLSQGQISNLLDAVSGLNGGKIITLLMGGDKPIPIRCGAVAFDVRKGQGTSQVFVVDTDETRIEGSGGFDLAKERLDLTIAPKPKNAGILSLRTPVHVFGTFREPDFALDKAGLALRGGGAVALALINPLAALLPLIETGPGEDTDCARLFASAQPGAKATSNTSKKP